MLIRISSRGIGDRGKQAFSLGTLRHQDIDLELVQRAQKKVDKYRGGYQAHGLRHAFMPAIVSTSGRIHGELLRLLYILADRKTTRSFQALGEEVEADAEAERWRRSEFFWHMRASLGLACAQVATLCTQVVVHPNAAFSVFLFCLLVRVALKLRSLRIYTPRLCRSEVYSYKSTFSLTGTERETEVEVFIEQGNSQRQAGRLSFALSCGLGGVPFAHRARLGRVGGSLWGWVL